MWRHCKEKYKGVIQNFRMDITGYYSNSATQRQITEAVRINKTPEKELVSNKKERNFITLTRVMGDISIGDQHRPTGGKLKTSGQEDIWLYVIIGHFYFSFQCNYEYVLVDRTKRVEQLVLLCVKDNSWCNR